MNEWIADLQHRFAASADPGEAQRMKAYMRHQFEFAGIKSPLRKEIMKAWSRPLLKPAPSLALIEETVRGLWELPEREYAYTAIDLLAKQVKRLDDSHLSMLESLVVAKPWWDTVDLLAGGLIGPLLLRYPQLERDYPERWIESDHLWLQRTALLYQLKYKQHTDKDRLFDYIRRKTDSREFFICKAIGWALREYSKTDADAVIRFVGAEKLSPLSEREALKSIRRGNAPA